MKSWYFNCPNGRWYRIIGRPVDAVTPISSKYHIETLIRADAVDNEVFKLYYPDGRWEFLQDCKTLIDALSTLCLFNHHRVDVVWIQQFETTAIIPEKGCIANEV
jgi:hypothetical protein